jgi:phage/plasmid-like protein (TIGR03299 family)
MHGITQRDGVFAVRDAGWHGLCEVLPDHPTRQEAQAIAHPWEPITEPVYRKVPQVAEDGTLVEHYEVVEDFQAVVRSDDGTTLSVNPTSLEVVKNSTMYDIAEVLEGVDKASVKYETGGSLFGGRKVWLLLRLAEPLVIKGSGPHSEVIPYYALQDSKDGTGSFRGQATMTKIVCDNTCQMADLDASVRGTEFVFRHSKNINERIEEAKAALAGWRESVQAFRLMSEHLCTVDVTKEQRELFIEQFIPMPQVHTVSQRVVSNVESARNQLRGILDGPTCEGIGFTSYGLVQASVEYLNHYRKARTAETRFKRAYLDRSRITADAVELAQLVATQ